MERFIVHKRRDTALPAGVERYSFAPADVAAILEAVRWYYRLPTDWLRRRSRFRPIVDARQTATYMLTLVDALTLTEIAVILGYTNHATMVHSRNVVEQRIQLYTYWERCIKNIHAEAVKQCDHAIIYQYTHTT